MIRGGVLEHGRHRLAVSRLTQSGGTLEGGAAPLLVEGAARVLGGLLETPRDVMIVGTLDIRAPGIVRVGAGGRLEIAGDGTPLTGDGLLDVTTNGPTSVEYTGRATSDLSAAGPAGAYRRLGDGREPDRGVRRLAAGQHGPSGAPAPLGFGDPATSLTLQRGEWWLSSAVIDPAAGFAYFATRTGRVTKIRLSDFSRAGALALASADEQSLFTAVIDLSRGLAYFGTNTGPGIVLKIRLSDLTRAGSLTLDTVEEDIGYLTSAVLDPASALAYFGTTTSPPGTSPIGTIFRVDVSAPAPPCTSFTLAPSSAYPDDRSGSVPVAVTGVPAGCRGGSWTTSGNGSWLTADPASGSGPGSATVSFTQNTAAASRTASATIAGQPFTVTQAAAPPVLGIDDVSGDGRFRAQVRWSTTQGGNDGKPHAGQPLPTASIGVSRGGLFWFFQADNPEMLVKVLNGCSVNGKYWVFASAGTNVGTTTGVTDTVTGAVRTYVNPDLTAAQPVPDTAAFGCD